MRYLWAALLGLAIALGASRAEAVNWCPPGPFLQVTSAGYLKFATGTTVTIKRHSDLVTLATTTVDSVGQACVTLTASTWVDVTVATTPTVTLTNLWADIGS